MLFRRMDFFSQIHHPYKLNVWISLFEMKIFTLVREGSQPSTDRKGKTLPLRKYDISGSCPLHYLCGSFCLKHFLEDEFGNMHTMLCGNKCAARIMTL